MSQVKCISFFSQFQNESQFDPENDTHRKMDVTLKFKFNDPRYRDEFILLLFERNKELGEGIWNIQAPDAVMAYTKAMLLENMALTDWIAKHIIRDPESRIERTELWEFYENTGDGQLKKQEFYKQIKLSGFKEVKSSTMFFKGMRKNEEVW